MCYEVLLSQSIDLPTVIIDLCNKLCPTVLAVNMLSRNLEIGLNRSEDMINVSGSI